MIAFEVNSQHASGLVNLCYPYFTLEPVLAYLNVQTWASRERGRRESGREERLLQLNEIDIPFVARLPNMDVPLREVVQLQVGDVLTFDASITDPVVVFAGDRPKFLARPVRMGNKMAVQITERIVNAHEVRYLNSVEKTETYIL